MGNIAMQKVLGKILLNTYRYVKKADPFIHSPYFHTDHETVAKKMTNLYKMYYHLMQKSSSEQKVVDK